MSKLNIKKGDKVVVITGKDKGTSGKITMALPKANRVVVEGVNVVTRHKKTTRADAPGGRLEMEAPINASNVMLVCPKCSKATRVGHKIENGKKSRVCKKCNASID